MTVYFGRTNMWLKYHIRLEVLYEKSSRFLSEWNSAMMSHLESNFSTFSHKFCFDLKRDWQMEFRHFYLELRELRSEFITDFDWQNVNEIESLCLPNAVRFCFFTKFGEINLFLTLTQYFVLHSNTTILLAS